MSTAAFRVRWAEARRELAEERPRLTWREELVTCILGAWMLGGLHLDGWAHKNLKVLDTIWTPWHAVFYSGGIATMAWIVAQALRGRRETGEMTAGAIPQGYALGLVGVAVFFVAAIGDQIWHLSLGIERDLAAFLSPTHLGLAIAIFLMVSSPLRAVWGSNETETPGFVEFLPALFSLILTVDFVAFLFNYIVMFPSNLPGIANSTFRNHYPGIPTHTIMLFTERFRVQGVSSVLLTTMLLLAPVLLALRRWRLPFGSVTLLFVIVGSAVGAVYEMRQCWTLIAAGVAGIVADLLIRRWRPSEWHRTAYHVFGAVVPLVLWTTYFIVYEIAYGIGWAAEFWSGSIVLATLFGVLLTALTLPQRIPVAVEAAAALEAEREAALPR